MKLRLQGNSVRLRLTRSEVERLRETGLVEESIEFGSGELLVYRLQSRREPGPVEATFRQGVITVSSHRTPLSLGRLRRSRPVCAKRRPQYFD